MQSTVVLGCYKKISPNHVFQGVVIQCIARVFSDYKPISCHIPTRENDDRTELRASTKFSLSYLINHKK